MKLLLSRDCHELLAQLAWSKVLLAFDFDGTLAPIVSDRDRAGMRDETSRLLARVSDLYPCAVISGRSKDDVMARLGAARIRYVVGNHGLEPGGDLHASEREMATARPMLDKALAGLQGVELEDKRYSMAVHYRKSRQKRLAREAIHRAVSSLPIAMRMIAGKLVVNVVPQQAPNKGDALLQLREREEAHTALYVGDDVTDEDVFQLDQPGRLLSVRVGISRGSAAKYFLRSQREIDSLLARLVELRSPETRA